MQIHGMHKNTYTDTHTERERNSPENQSERLTAIFECFY